MRSSSFGISRRRLLTAAGITGAAAVTGVWRAGVAAATGGPSSYTASWSSVDQHPPAPEWFQDAKFGIYYHWGAFSVPAFGNEWYPRNMYNNGSAENNHHKSVYGDPSAWPYHNFINGARDKAGNCVQFAPKLTLGRRQLRPGRVGAAVRRRGRQVRRAGRRAPRRLLDVEQQRQRVELGAPGARGWTCCGCTPTRSAAKGLKLLVAMHHAYNFTGYYQYVPAQSDPSLRKLYGQLGTPRRTSSGTTSCARSSTATSPTSSGRTSTWAPVAGVVPAELPVVLLQPGGRLEQGRRRHLQGRLQQPGRGLRLRARRPGRHPDPVLADRRQHLQLQLVLHGRASATTRLNADAALADRPGQQERQHAAQHRARWPTAPSRPGSARSCSASATTSSRFGESIYATRAWSAYGEGPTQMGGGSFSTPRAGTAQDIRFTRSKDNRVLYATVLGWPGSTAEHHHAELEPDQPQHA